VDIPLTIGKAPPDPTPRPGHVVEAVNIPRCQRCEQRSGRWDVKTNQGPWGNFCDACAPGVAMYVETGVGKGQLWILH
jgi:hypothetical protein